MTTYYVSPTGNDTNAGTSIGKPLATIGAAHDLVEAGDTIFLRGGTYDLPTDTRTTLSKSGTEDDPIRLMAYRNEQPVLDGSDWARGNREALIVQTGDYWHVEGLEITGGPFLGHLANSVKGSVYKSLEAHSNDNTGFSLTGESVDNLISGGDFYNNFDPLRNGQDADGIAVKFGSGEGNVIDGARLYNNSDDGLDMWDFAGSVTVRNTLAYGNGVDRWDHGPSFEGNGVGFKLSGGDAQSLTDLAHVIENNVAWGNAVRGFTSNGNVGQMIVTNNTSYDNGFVDFQFNEGNHILRNNLSFGSNNDAIIASGMDDANNSWTLDVDVDRRDFRTLNDRGITGPREPDGSLRDNNFLDLVAGSDLVDAGVETGGAFAGAAPDLGAFELGLVDAAASDVLRFIAINSDAGSGQRLDVANFDLNFSGQEDDLDVLEITSLGETYRASTDAEMLELVRLAEGRAPRGMGAADQNGDLAFGFNGGGRIILDGIAAQLDPTALAAALQGEDLPLGQG